MTEILKDLVRTNIFLDATVNHKIREYQGKHGIGRKDEAINQILREFFKMGEQNGST